MTRCEVPVKLTGGRGERRGGRGRAVLVALVLLAGASACGGGGDGDEGATADAPSSEAGTGSGAEPGVASQADELGRVVVLGEDFLLADVLALGVQPVAATSTLGDTFSGIERDTSGIEPLDQLQLNAEQLAALRPDTLIVGQYVVDEVGIELLESVADTIVVPNDSDWRAAFTTLAEEVGATEAAEGLLADYDEAVARADEALPDDVSVSMPTVYSGENLAVWTDGPVNIPSTFLDAGVTLDPGAGELDGEQGGRVYISLERIGELDGDVIVMLQTEGVEGEDAALDAVQGNELWQTLPAVREDRVVVIDRLGYAGVEGRIRLAGELPDLLPT
ncbi:ABC transporter substrate-binding protein [Iamia majanohamensis]|uniref:ABC transporter substrate-binding protein n=1 Tax=Iamia majanohamensis TaxID=467976 RepID=A0AAE9YHW1_9ACTN|nr:ABC transporter substrate-binding protein [Iamia majanohamensis]WCO68792.1 ABC transporter substrate-binding protein [Iamia majanohamensis]